MILGILIGIGGTLLLQGVGVHLFRVGCQAFAEAKQAEMEAQVVEMQRYLASMFTSESSAPDEVTIVRNRGLN